MAKIRLLAVLRELLLRIPLVLKTVLLHVLRLSPVTGKQDLRTELTVAIIRSFLSFSMPVSKQQQRSTHDPGVRGPLWVSKVRFPRPEDDVRRAVFAAIDALKTGGETYDEPGVMPVEAEWTGYRSGVGRRTPLPDISEEEKYKRLLKESPADMTVIYFHGGAYYLMDPCTHRVTTSRISKLTGAPVLSVRYRLAPQNPFPAALVDALVAYLSVLHPPPGSLHAPVPASKVVFMGDSAGGNLCLVLLQTLLTLRRVAPTVRFHGRDVPVELPAGVSLFSPWCDMTRTMPSIVINAKYDYLDPPPCKLPLHHAHPEPAPPETLYHPWPFPDDHVWPCNPPRVDIYSNANAVMHPLVSPLAGSKDLWKNSPPIFITMGEEGLTDEGLLFARKVHQAGVPVIVEQFEGMPHCFGMIMVGSRAGRRCFEAWTGFSRDVVAGRIKKRSAKEEEAEPAASRIGKVTFIGYKLRWEKQIPLDEVHPFNDDKVEALMRQGKQWRVESEKALLSRWYASKKAKL
ncbi:hypothetical protein VTN00DRAFT_1718 [Thermoascus crustaceus]|uniref:uncharacterized protein n=1 Tax=Thermoascus crustaceus TaxID=5088 RepID=UPI003743AA7D